MLYVHVCDGDMILMSNSKGSKDNRLQNHFYYFGGGSVGLNQGLEHAKHALCH